MAMALSSSTRGKRSWYFSRLSADVAALRSRWAWSTNTAGMLASVLGSQSAGIFSRNNSMIAFEDRHRSRVGLGVAQADARRRGAPGCHQRLGFVMQDHKRFAGVFARHFHVVPA